MSEPVEPRFLDLQEVIEVHRDQIERYGGDPGVRDMGLLQSAVAMPGAGVLGQYLHGDIFEMAAAYLFHIVQNHPFVDGNKRAGAASALVFLELNGVRCTAADEAIVDSVLAVAEGHLPKSGVAEFFRSRTSPSKD